MQLELEIAFPVRFAGLKVNSFAERSRELAMVECAQLQAANEQPFQQQVVDLESILLQMMQPPLLHPNAPTNPLRELERSFENAYAELSTHCGVPNPAELTLHAFFHRLEYFEKLAPSQP